MKKILKLIKYFFIAILVLGVIGAIFGKDDNSSNSSSNTPKQTETNTTQKKEEVKEPEPEIEYQTISVSELMNDLETNALSASEKYKGKYLEITGKLSTIDSSGKYISLVPSDSQFAFTGVQCYMKNDEQRSQVANMATDDIVVLRGKCKDVGEVLGYSLDIDSIDGYDVAIDTNHNIVDGYIVKTADELADELKTNALKAQNDYKKQKLSVYGKLDSIDSSGKYITIDPIYDPYSFTNIQCYIKSDDIKSIVMDLTTGDLITIKGVCNDVGELLGYSIDIESIER